MVSLQSIIWVFFLNNFSRVINLLLTKLARDLPGRILALGLFCTGLAALGTHCQDLGPIFSQYGSRAWLITKDIFIIYQYVFDRALLVKIRNLTQHVPAKLVEYQSDIPQFSKEPACCKKYWKDNKQTNKQTSLHLCSYICP